MHLLALSLNYKKVPIELREKLAFAESELAAAMATLKESQSVFENVILSTCNRTEIYAVVDQTKRGEDYLKRFLANWFHLSITTFSGYLDVYQELEVANYLFRVTCGLESLIVGEEQILSQVKSSFLFAQENQATGSVLNTLFKSAITLSKKAHTETLLSRNSVSVGSAAVQLTKNIWSDLSDKKAAVIGAGQMSELSAKYIAAQKIAGLTISNRTYEKAQKLAEHYHAEAVKLTELEKLLTEVDFAFSSTSSKSFILNESLVRIVQAKRDNKPLILFDLAVPRDIEPSVRDITGVKLYDIDDLERLVKFNKSERQKAEKEVEKMILKATDEFKNWLSAQQVTPIIAELQEKSMQIQEKVMETIDHKLTDLSVHDRKVINKLTKSIVNQLLREPILTVKSLATDENSPEKLTLFKQIFNLSEDQKR
ncbi:glutamyl-tRNA reductase [Lactococcus allomyrinae]|uniref:Glutamyl-tRNA reductase n=1 Tax=Lactococcus allomyrinae TaxID=2419773 RepID=A0A387BGY7_9LACT|nr:glutamyl-tRNA reductase [Lactococcus allomyrinae]AYG00130.1 glutamyl-tRNA reductase [Lactococcus allomyrinae]